MLTRALALLVLFGAAPACAAEAELVVPVRTIYPGDVISAASLSMRAFDLRDGQGAAFVRLPDTLEGKVARRTLLANQPIPVQGIEEPRLALVGRQVRVEFREGGLVITTFGSVLQAGSLGDTISVRVLDGGRTIFGVVQRDGSVRVGEGQS
ncbi:MAG: Flagellar basal body P-ring biosynthesis protein-like protein [Hyphomicrobiales bacterium]|nr:Flagellar basal body P-ring biosynthesis protein-like protein [Hyphomicrobiales bacterium]